MSQGNNNTKILNNLYSRQIGTIGKESMDNLMKKKNPYFRDEGKWNRNC